MATSSTSVQLIPSPTIPSGHSPHSNPLTVDGSLKQGTPGKHGLKRQKSWTIRWKTKTECWRRNEIVRRANESTSYKNVLLRGLNAVVLWDESDFGHSAHLLMWVSRNLSEATVVRWLLQSTPHSKIWVQGQFIVLEFLDKTLNSLSVTRSSQE